MDRVESDSLGSLNIPKDALWGIHTQRALQNFKVSRLKVNEALICALASVKKACCMANAKTGYLTQEKATAIIQACDEIKQGKHVEQFLIDALQGGAGTSTNMNINEVIANRSLEILGYERGRYDVVHPINDVNKHQSTNDVYPTAVKIAILQNLELLSQNIKHLQGAFQKKEKDFADVVKIGRTEMQVAVPLTLGAEFSAFAEAIARDRWRIFKCEERIRCVNLGGTAIGTGLTAPQKYIFKVIEELREVTGLGLSRAENTVDQTANSDSFVEVAGILKAHISNLIKIANDLRLMNMLSEVELKVLQAGSSIMPGKANPVILELVIQASLRACSDCDLVFQTASRSSFQINEFIPLLATSILESLDILINANKILADHVLDISDRPEACSKYVDDNPLIITVFLQRLGYERCEQLLKEFLSVRSKQPSIRVFLATKLGKEMVDKMLSSENIMALGHRDDGKST